MPPIPTTEPVSPAALWTGRIMSALPVLALVASAIMKFAQPPSVVEGFSHFGIRQGLVVPLGVIELVCTAIYLLPRTAVLGAILLTGYLGGAIFTTVRVGDGWIPAFILGIFLWGGLYLRDPRVKALIPCRG